jgi:hypothetical protein
MVKIPVSSTHFCIHPVTVSVSICRVMLSNKIENDGDISSRFSQWRLQIYRLLFARISEGMNSRVDGS